MRPTFLLILLTALWASVSTAPAATPPQSSNRAKTAEPAGNRYLFVAETSTAMQKRDEKLRQAVFDTVYSGVSGRMTPGDTFGLWLYNAETDTRFPMQIWDPSKRLDLGGRVNTYMRERGYRKHSNLKTVVRDINSVLRSVGDVTVVLFNDGDDKISGTPFDREINGYYKELAAELEESKEPFITVLVAERGEFVAYAVARPGEDLMLPPVNINPARKRGGSQPPPAEIVESPIRPAVTNRSPRHVSQIVITKESNAADQAAAAQARTTAPPASTVPSGPVSDPVPVPVPAPASAQPSVASNSPPAVTTTPAPVVPTAPVPAATPVPAPQTERPAQPLVAAVTTRVFPPANPTGSNSTPASTPAAATPTVPAVAQTVPAPPPAPKVLPTPAVPASNPPAPAPTVAQTTPNSSNAAHRVAPPLVSTLLPFPATVSARAASTSSPPSTVVTAIAIPASPASRSNSKLYGAVALLLGALGSWVAFSIRSRSRQQGGSYISQAMPRAPGSPARKPR